LLFASGQVDDGMLPSNTTEELNSRDGSPEPIIHYSDLNNVVAAIGAVAAACASPAQRCAADPG
jgi:hypothetical protein